MPRRIRNASRAQSSDVKPVALPRPVAIARINNQIDAAIILPEIDSYPEDQIELIAAVGVRETFKLKDGDSVVIDVRAA